MGARAGALAAVALAGALLAACGIPIESTARAVPRSQVPGQLLSPVVPTTTPPCAKGCTTVKVYMIATGRYVLPEPRVVAGTPPSVTSVVGVLLRGPLHSEQAHGVQTALNGVKLLSVSLQQAKKLATVNFNPSFGLLSGPEQVLGVAQVVFTVAGVEGTAIGVSFQISGFNTDVPIDTGGLVNGPVHVSQYASLLSPSVATTTTTATGVTGVTAPAAVEELPAPSG